MRTVCRPWSRQPSNRGLLVCLKDNVLATEAIAGKCDASGSERIADRQQVVELDFVVPGFEALDRVPRDAGPRRQVGNAPFQDTARALALASIHQIVERHGPTRIKMPLAAFIIVRHIRAYTHKDSVQEPYQQAYHITWAPI